MMKKNQQRKKYTEMREGVREIGGLTADGNDGSMVGKAVVLM